jgi:hypothetical protein
MATDDPTTDPTPAATSTPTAEVTGTAPPTSESRAGWRWPENRRNRIAASVAIAAGAVAVVAAIFTGGVAAGAHGGGDGELAWWGHHSEMSADREHTPTGQVLIIPGGETARGGGDAGSDEIGGRGRAAFGGVQPSQTVYRVSCGAIAS